jgi:hypothetical protein
LFCAHISYSIFENASHATHHTTHCHSTHPHPTRRHRSIPIIISDEAFHTAFPFQVTPPPPSIAVDI